MQYNYKLQVFTFYNFNVEEDLGWNRERTVTQTWELFFTFILKGDSIMKKISIDVQIDGFNEMYHLSGIETHISLWSISHHKWKYSDSPSDVLMLNQNQNTEIK